MSRIGRQPVVIPAGVKAEVKDSAVTIEGPKGRLAIQIRPEVRVGVEGGRILVEAALQSRPARAYHGLARALIASAVKGVTTGFQRRLDIVGVGYNAMQEGKDLVLQIGFSHPVKIQIPNGLKLEIPNPTRIAVNGPDKQQVGQFAAEIRKVRPPEPYNGKGIKYDDEVVKRKAGKAFVGGEK